MEARAGLSARTKVECDCCSLLLLRKGVQGHSWVVGPLIHIPACSPTLRHSLPGCKAAPEALCLHHVESRGHPFTLTVTFLQKVRPLAPDSYTHNCLHLPCVSRRCAAKHQLQGHTYIQPEHIDIVTNLYATPCSSPLHVKATQLPGKTFGSGSGSSGTYGRPLIIRRSCM